MKTRIRELRARLDLSQEALGVLVGARRETIGFIEKGDYNPSLLLSHRIARALGATIDEVFLFEEKDGYPTS